MSYIAIGGMAVSLIGGIVGKSAAKKREREAAADKRRLGIELNRLENSRQAVINPYATTKDMSSLIVNQSGQLSNAFANLGVATQASKFEAEQIDISLANTLDTLKETGAGAGGATALANAALKAKKGISANIEQQEVKNDQLKAQGEMALQSEKLAENARVQGAQLSEAQRVQAAEAAGKTFMFNATENREQQLIDRTAGQLGLAANRQYQAGVDKTAAITGALGSIGSMAGSLGNMANTPSTPSGSSGTNYANQFGAMANNFTSNPFGNSDRRLKKNINQIGKSPNGLNIYSFEYIDTKFGNGLFQGVMSDEVPTEAVIKGNDGYDRVNYSLLDVEFKQI
jgi:hypothetical protein